LSDEAASPAQPEPQCNEEDVREQQEAASGLIETRTDEEDEDEDVSPQEVEAPRRSERARNPPSERLNVSSVKGQSCSGIKVEDEWSIKCDTETALVLMMIMCTFGKCQVNQKVEVGVQNVVAHLLNKAIKKWGQSATDAALKEMKQLQN